jgi:hypothetical protein
MFEDVIEVVVDDPEVYWTNSGLFGMAKIEQQIRVFRKGDKVFGNASGHSSRSTQPLSRKNGDFDFAKWIAVEHPRSDRMDFPDAVLEDFNILWFRRDEVELFYQINQSEALILRKQLEDLEL